MHGRRGRARRESRSIQVSAADDYRGPFHGDLFFLPWLLVGTVLSCVFGWRLSKPAGRSSQATKQAPTAPSLSAIAIPIPISSISPSISSLTWNLALTSPDSGPSFSSSSSNNPSCPLAIQADGPSLPSWHRALISRGTCRQATTRQQGASTGTASIATGTQFDRS